MRDHEPSTGAADRSRADTPAATPSAPFDLPPDATLYRARCPAATAQRLLPYDHHRVRVNDQLGVLVTYPLMGQPLGASVDVWIVVHASASQHPTAPDEVQSVVDALTVVPTDDGASHDPT